VAVEKILAGTINLFVAIPKVNIVPFKEHHQLGIDKLMEGVASEFAEQIYSPSSKKIIEVSQLPGRKYWVALAGEKVIGTVGFMSLENNCGALKSMMLDRVYRSSDTQIAKRLLQTVIDWALKQNISFLYLGTMYQFIAAQRFYEKNGFHRIEESELPQDFPANPVDKVFYLRQLN
jgi:N-acetylglutamate synthase-like GNAT family acetyltransferase